MKIILRKPPNWIGPYHIADRISEWFNLSENTNDRVGDFILSTKLNTLLNFIYKKRKRKNVIRIHDYDLWNADITIATVILPILQSLKNDSDFYFSIDNDDVPDNLKSLTENDEKFLEKTQYILVNMIKPFVHINDGRDSIITKDEYNEGMRLFSKYLPELWS